MSLRNTPKSNKPNASGPGKAAKVPVKQMVKTNANVNVQKNFNRTAKNK